MTFFSPSDSLRRGATDAQLAFLGVWSNYTPTLTQTVTVTKTVNFSRYCRVGRIVFWNGRVTATSGGTSNTRIALTLPVPTPDPSAAPFTIGGGWFYNSSSAVLRTVQWNTYSTTGMDMLSDESTNGAPVGDEPTLALASGDIISWSVFYEAA